MDRSLLTLIAILLSSACSGIATDTATETGAGEEVVLHQGDAPGVSGVETFFTVSAPADAPPGDDVGVLAERLVAPISYPGPSASDKEHCFLQGMVTIGGVPLESYTLAYTFGEVSVEVEVQYQHWMDLEGEMAVAASTPGTALTLAGESTGAIVPEPVVVDDLADRVVSARESGTLVVEWEPSTVGGDAVIVVTAMAPSSRGLWCVLSDDGVATIEVGEALSEARHATIRRRSEALVDHSEYGRTYISLERLWNVDLP